MIVTKEKKIPSLKAIDQIKLGKADWYRLDNDLKVCEVSSGIQNVIKLELVFSAGRWHEHHKAVSFFTAKLLKEGCRKYSSEQISEKIDFLGATLKVTSGMDHTSISVYCLTKHIENILIIVRELLNHPTFPEQEFLLHKKIACQKLLVNLERIEYLSQKELSKNIFGKSHPYGYLSDTSLFENIQKEELVRFYNTHFNIKGCKIIISGKTERNTRSLLNKYLGNNLLLENKLTGNYDHNMHSSPKKKIYIERDNATQAAIRLGRPIFTKNHNDYHGMKILNMVLGGFFGSRLMKNIREDKGYTYGIYSSLHTYLHEGIFYISSEVGSDVCKDALKETYKEIEKLKQELIPAEEIALVRNYSLGRILNSVDGPFNTAGIIKGLFLYGLDVDYFYNYIETIKTITPQELQDLAIQYFDTDTFYEVVVGKNQ